ncbi:hypothetical protein ABTK38_22580, partial [Acinetobacter baumannii]
MTLAVSFDGDDGPRVEFGQVLVCTSLNNHRPHALPDALRAALRRDPELKPALPIQYSNPPAGPRP